MSGLPTNRPLRFLLTFDVGSRLSTTCMHLLFRFLLFEVFNRLFNRCLLSWFIIGSLLFNSLLLNWLLLERLLIVSLIDFLLLNELLVLLLFLFLFPFLSVYFQN